MLTKICKFASHLKRFFYNNNAKCDDKCLHGHVIIVIVIGIIIVIVLCRGIGYTSTKELYRRLAGGSTVYGTTRGSPDQLTSLVR